MHAGACKVRLLTSLTAHTLCMSAGQDDRRRMHMTRLAPKIGFAQIVLGRHVNASTWRRDAVRNIHHGPACHSLDFNSYSWHLPT